MADSIIENPTYMEHVRHFFDDEDLDHMLQHNTDLTTYPALKNAASLVFQHTFHAVLKADGEPVARQAFFQSTQPTRCTACREKAIIDLDFQVEADAVIGHDLTADIEVLTPDADRIGRRFPLRACGDPTLNIRLLLQENA